MANITNPQVEEWEDELEQEFESEEEEEPLESAEANANSQPVAGRKRKRLQLEDFDIDMDDQEEGGAGSAYAPGIDEIMEFAAEITGRRRRKRRCKEGEVPTRRRPRAKLAPHLQQMLGDANVHYFREEYAQAVALLMEVIKQNPNVAEPYQTLGLIYEEMGDKKKALQFFLIAAHITPKDADQWLRYADMSREQGNLHQAAYCLTKVIRLKPDDIEALWERSKIYEQLNMPKKAIEGYQLILQHHPDHLESLVEIARLYHLTDQIPKAIELFEQVLERQHNAASSTTPKSATPTSTTTEPPPPTSPTATTSPPPPTPDLNIVNMLSELYRDAGEFEKAVALIDTLDVDTLPPDLAANYAICHAYLGHVDIADKHFNRILSLPVTEYGDLYYNIAETWLAVDMYDKAAAIFVQLVAVDAFNQPVVWWKLGRSLRLAGRLVDAARAFETVLAAEPNNIDARLALSEVFSEMGDERRALDVVRAAESVPADAVSTPSEPAVSAVPPPSSEELKVAIAKANLEFTMAQWDEFLATALPIVRHGSIGNLRRWLASGKSRKRRRLPEVLRQRLAKKGKSKFPKKPEPAVEPNDSDNLLQFTRPRRRSVKDTGEPDDELSPSDDSDYDRDEAARAADVAAVPSVVHALGEEGYYSLLIRAVKVLAYRRRFGEALQLITDALALHPSEPIRHELKFLAVGVAFNARDYVAAYRPVRYVAWHRPYSVPVWNLFTRLITKAGSFIANQRFLVRLLGRHPDSVPLMVLVGHYCCMAGSFRLGLAEYLRAYERAPAEPLIALCIGIAYLHRVVSRSNPQPHQTVLQAFTFLYRYWSLRGKSSQEAVYNLARALHQLGLVSLAVPLYERALSLDPPRIERPTREGAMDTGQGADESDEDALCDEDYDLRREAAFNLAQIYKTSGSPHLARQILRKYCTI